MPPDLPYGYGRPQPASIRLVVNTLPDEPLPIDGGASKCKALDKAAMKSFEDTYGRDGMRQARKQYGLNFLEADWLATPASLLYVSPGPEVIWRRCWADIEITPAQRGRRFSGVIVADDRMTWKIGLGTSAMANLLVIARYYLANDS